MASASYHLLINKSDNQVRNINNPNNSHIPNPNRSSTSTTQMCLHKILHTISTFPPPQSSPKSPLSSGDEEELVNRGFVGIDLNVKLGSPPPLETTEQWEEEVGPIAENKCSVDGGFDMREAVVSSTLEIEEDKVMEEVEMSKIVNNGGSIQPKHVQVEEEEEEHRVREGRLDLLIEAAIHISGEFEESEPEPKMRTTTKKEWCSSVTVRRGGGSTKKRKPEENWNVQVYGGDFEEEVVVSPVVRSKRGRTQVLPYKYRDSVLEPLKPLSRHRSSPTVSTKLRPR